MSIKLMSKIWEHPELARGKTIVTKGNKEVDQQNKLRTLKMVLLALADMANDEGVCWPSNKTIAERSNLTTDYVRSLMGTLRANGWLSTEERFSPNGKQTSNIITLNTAKIHEKATPNLLHPSHLVPPIQGDLVPPIGGHLVGGTIEPSIEPSFKSSSSDDEGDDKNARASVHRLWQQNMPGTLTTIIADDINDLVDTYGAEEVNLAITEAVRNNGRSIRYVLKILENRSAGKTRYSENGASGHKPGDVITVLNQYTGEVEKVVL